MDEPDVVTAEEIIETLGPEIYERMLSFRSHHESDGRVYWTRDEAERILGLIALEDGRRFDDEP
jgi:hypothetical protein